MVLRLAVLTVVWLLAFASLTFASSSHKPSPKDLKVTPPPPKRSEAVPTLVVPDVRRQPYVFAKGILEDAGFAWRVEGEVQGYAANIVAMQAPMPGTRIPGQVTPTVILKLERNPDYEERGLPQNESPYEGTELAEPAAEPKAPKAKAKAKAKANAAKPKSEADPAASKPVPKAASAVALMGTDHGVAKAAPVRPARAKLGARTPAFTVPGAPLEPLDEMPLTDRARMVRKRLAATSSPTDEIVKWWLYQHAWVVTGARFGWSEGADAIQIMIRADQDLQRRWGFGGKSEALARAALAEVERLEREYTSKA